MKNIQVFLVGDTTAEINGDLVSIDYSDGLAFIKTKEPGFKEVWEHNIPIAQLHMIRISNH